LRGQLLCRDRILVVGKRAVGVLLSDGHSTVEILDVLIRGRDLIDQRRHRTRRLLRRGTRRSHRLPRAQSAEHRDRKHGP